MQARGPRHNLVVQASPPASKRPEIRERAFIERVTERPLHLAALK